MEVSQASSMNVNGSLSVNGQPIIPSLPFPIRQPVPGGLVIYVGTNAGAQTGNTTLTATTLATALSMLNNRQNLGDIIYLMPGYTDSISTADYYSNTGTASGFSIIGLGSGTQRPTLTWTAAAATWLIDTAGVQIANVQMYMAGASATGALTVAAPITISAAGCSIIGCYVPWGWDADSIVGIGITTTAAANFFQFIGNECIAVSTAAPTTTFMQIVGGDSIYLGYNYISGPTSGTTVGVVRGLTTAATNMLVERNYMANLTASSTIAYSPLTASTVTIQYNSFVVASGILPVTASIGNLFQNYANNTAGKTGALVGTVSA